MSATKMTRLVPIATLIVPSPAAFPNRFQASWCRQRVARLRGQPLVRSAFIKENVRILTPPTSNPPPIFADNDAKSHACTAVTGIAQPTHCECRTLTISVFIANSQPSGWSSLTKRSSTNSNRLPGRRDRQQKRNAPRLAGRKYRVISQERSPITGACGQNEAGPR